MAEAGESQGRKMPGRWTLGRAIGHGAHGAVFLASGPCGPAAVKECMRPAGAEGVRAWERELNGWRLFASIPPHPGLVKVFDMWLSDGGDAFYVAMELADPEVAKAGPGSPPYRPLTLASAASAEVALPMPQCLDVAERLASALEHLQSHHLIHRDVKPGNVLYVGGRPVIADAGLVADVREAASVVGTPGYVPPENHGSAQGDIFSLGRTLWRIATGRQPEEAGSAPCAEADTSDPDFRAFLALVDRALSASPDRRYRSAKAMRKAIARLRLARRMRRARKVAAIAAAAALAAAAFAAGLAFARKAQPGAVATGPLPPGHGGGERRQVQTGDDPLDALREGIRSGKIHIMTPGEARRMADDVNGAVKDAAKGILDGIGPN